MPQIPSESPVEEYKRRCAVRRRNAKGVIAATAIASVFLQATATALFALAMKLQKEAFATAALRAELLAAGCGIVAFVVAIVNWTLLPRRWIAFGSVPWLVLVVEVVLVSLYFAALMGYLR